MSDDELTAIVQGITDAVMVALRRELDDICTRLAAVEQRQIPTPAAASAPVASVTAGIRPRFRGAHQVGADYSAGDVVRMSDGNLFVARTSGRLGAPAEDAYWRRAV